MYWGELHEIFLSKGSAGGCNSFMNALSRFICKPENCVRILNPLSADLNVMRQTLLFNMLEAVQLNANRKNPTFYTYPYRANSHMLAFQLSVWLMGIVSQRYLPCLYCNAACSRSIQRPMSSMLSPYQPKYLLKAIRSVNPLKSSS